LYNNFSDFKACVVERFNRTLLNRISKYFTHTKEWEYISVLPKLLKSYNSTTHRMIGMSPKSVNKFNEMDVWLYANKDLYTIKKKKVSLKLYDKVRLCKKRGVFEKGYAPSYTTEIFEISEILDTIPTTFRIRDMKNEVLKGIFYEQELVRIKSLE